MAKWRIAIVQIASQVSASLHVSVLTSVLTNTLQAGAGWEEHEKSSWFDGQVMNDFLSFYTSPTYRTLPYIRLQPGKLDLLCLPEMVLTGKIK